VPGALPECDGPHAVTARIAATAAALRGVLRIALRGSFRAEVRVFREVPASRHAPPPAVNGVGHARRPEAYLDAGMTTPEPLPGQQEKPAGGTRFSLASVLR